MVTVAKCPLYAPFPELEERLPRLDLCRRPSPVRRLSALDSLKSELEKKRRGESSELMGTLIVSDWNEALGPYTRDPAEIVRQ